MKEREAGTFEQIKNKQSDLKIINIERKIGKIFSNYGD